MWNYARENAYGIAFGYGYILGILKENQFPLELCNTSHCHAHGYYRKRIILVNSRFIEATSATGLTDKSGNTKPSLKSTVNLMGNHIMPLTWPRIIISCKIHALATYQNVIEQQFHPVYPGHGTRGVSRLAHLTFVVIHLTQSMIFCQSTLYTVAFMCCVSP